MNLSIFLLLVNLIALISVFYIFEYKKERNVKIKVKPGMKYKYNNNIYKIPDLKLVGTPYLLEEKFYNKMRKLFQNSNKVFKNLNIKTWVSGGTLIGFHRHKTFIPWDDDLDIHTSVENKSFMFTEKFKKDLSKEGIEAIYMTGMSEDFSFYKGGIRLKLIGEINPVMDIFFVNKSKDKIMKIENWKKKDVFDYNQKEKWEIDEIFPLQTKIIDDMEVNMPNKPLDVLKRQYGDDVMNIMYGNNLPHSLAYDLLSVIWEK